MSLSSTIAQVVEGPLTLDQLEELVSIPTPDKAIAHEIRSRGISFEINDSVISRVKRLGIGAEALSALEVIRNEADLAFRKRRNEIRILVSEFDQKRTGEISVSELFASKLRMELRSYSQITIVGLDRTISPIADSPQELRKEFGVDLLIWGVVKELNGSFSGVLNVDTPPDYVTPLWENQLSFRTELKTEDYVEVINSQTNQLLKLTLLNIALISLKNGHADSAVEILSQVIAKFEKVPGVVSSANLFLMRAQARIAASCGFPAWKSDQISKDLESAEAHGLAQESPEILLIRAMIASPYVPTATLGIAKSLKKHATNDFHTLVADLLLARAYEALGDVPKTKESAESAALLAVQMQIQPENATLISQAISLVGDYKKAKDILQQLLRSERLTDTQKFDLELANGMLLLNEEAWNPASRSFSTAITLAPNCPTGYALKAITLVETGGRMGDAISLINQAIELAPDMPEPYAIRAQIYLEDGDLESAISNYKIAVSHNRGAFAFRGLGEVQKKAEQFSSAIDSFTRYLEEVFRDQEILEERGALYKRLGVLSKATKDYEESFYLLLARSTDADDRSLTLTFMDLTSLLFEMGDYDSGISVSSEYIGARPNEAIGYEKRAFFSSFSGDQDAALADLSRAILINPNDSSNYKSRAKLLIEKKQYERALEDLHILVRLEPGRAENFLLRASIYKQIGKLELGLQDVEAAQKLSPNSPKVFDAKSDILRGLRREKDSIDSMILSFRLTLNGESRLDRQSALNKFLVLSETLEKQNLNELGIEISTEFIKKNPDNFWGFSKRAGFYNAIEDSGNAVRDITEGIRLSPENTSLLRRRSTLYLQMGMHDQMVNDLVKIASIYAHSDSEIDQLRLPLFYSSTVRELESKELFIPLKKFISHFVEANENNISFLLDRAKASESLKDFPSAIVDLRAALLKNAERVDLLARIADLYMKQGKSQSAIDAISEAISNSPKDPKWFSKRAEYFSSMGNYDAAVKDASKAVEVSNPEDKFVYRLQLQTLVRKARERVNP